MLLCFSYCTMLLNWVWQLSQMNPSNDCWFSDSFLIWLKLEVVFSWILAGFSAGCESEEICVSGGDILVESRPRSETSGLFFFFSVEGCCGVGGVWSVEKPNCSSGTQSFLCPMYSISVEKPAPQCPQLKLSKSEPNLFGFVFSFSSCWVSSVPGLGSESLLVLVLRSDLSRSASSFLLVLSVLGLPEAGWGCRAGQSRLLMPNSARWAIRHWSNCRVFPCNTKRYWREPRGQTNLRHVHVSGQAVLGYPGHVLPRSDVDLGDSVRRVFVQDDSDLPGVDTPPHVLLVRSLQTNNISIIFQ